MCTCRFGKLRWFSILAATGHCDKNIVSAVNKAHLIKWQLKLDEVRTHTQDGRNLGTRHERSEAYVAREQARLASTQADDFEQEWWDYFYKVKAGEIRAAAYSSSETWVVCWWWW